MSALENCAPAAEVMAVPLFANVMSVTARAGLRVRFVAVEMAAVAGLLSVTLVGSRTEVM